MYPIEVCLSCDDDRYFRTNLTRVFDAGVQRIEVCQDMKHDGLTPDYQSLRIARQVFKRPGLLAMIRPRQGDFSYLEHEVDLMLKQIGYAAKAGVDGVVFGALNQNNNALDLAIMDKLVNHSRSLNLEVGVHRAFDAIEDRELALKQLIALGVDRVLTSGNSWGTSGTAIDGISHLVKTLAAANGNIEVVIAGGISSNSAKSLLKTLPLSANRVSFHAFSSVLQNELICRQTVRELVQIN